MTYYPALFTLCLLALCCKQPAEHATQKVIADTPVTKPADITPPFIHYYKYDSSHWFKQNLFAGWIDTFTVNRTKFRLLTDSNGDATIEVFTKGQWKYNTGVSLQSIWDAGFRDVNGDGCVDFVNTHKRGVTIYFFNAAINLFDTTEWDIAGRYEKLDEKRKIYYNAGLNDGPPLMS